MLPTAGVWGIIHREGKRDVTEGQGSDVAARSPKGLHRFAVFTTACTFVLLIAGALVTSNDAGLSVSTWPFAPNGILPRMVGGVLYEYSHRMIAGFVGLATIVLAAWAWRRESRAWVRWLAMAALLLVVAQAGLGAANVLLYLPAPVTMAHSALAQLFFCTLVALCLFTGKWWQSDLEPLGEEGRPALRAVAGATAAVIFLQIILGAAFRGAAFRHNAVGVLPHVFGAGVVTAMVAWTAAIVFTRHGDVAPLRRAVKLLMALLAAQLALGIAAYWAVLYQEQLPQPYPLPVVLTVAHVVNGALVLAASVWLALAAFRLFGPVPEWAMVPAALKPRPGRGGQTASVRPS